MLGPPVQGRAGLSLCGPSPLSAASLFPGSHWGYTHLPKERSYSPRTNCG